MMDQEKIWDYFQNDEEAGEAVFNARPRYEHVARQISPGMHVLDIGVGRGGLESLLVRKNVHISALDPGERSIAMVRERFGLGESAKVGFSQDIPFPDGQFDAVVMCEVLEHLSNEVRVASFREISRVLKPGGRLLGTVPADENLLDNRVVCPHCGEVFHRWGHLQSFTEGRLRSLLEEQFCSVAVSRHFFGEVRTVNWKGRLIWAMKKTLVSVGVKGNYESFFFSATRR
jgi:cyclopropane fatty-acyl-phospholipid synthase-like methyltransferase